MSSTKKRAYHAEFLKYGSTETDDRGQQKSQCFVYQTALTAESFEKKQLQKYLDKVYSRLSSKPLAHFENLEAGIKKQR